MSLELFKNDPLLNIKFIHVDQLSANGWNPNVVLNQELKLLEYSLMKSGWLQPILINRNNMIIDGFHRYSLSKISKAVSERYQGLVPCAVFDIDDAQAMLMTIRINRAKGSHVAFKMHEIVRRLVDEFNIDTAQIEKEIGAYKGEVDLLYQEDVFKKKDIQNHTYSQAWEPKNK